MRQRPCVSFPKPPADGAPENSALVTHMVHYMLQSGNSEVPVMFLDKEDLQERVEKAYTGTTESAEDVTEVDGPIDSVANAVSSLTVMAMSKPTGCIAMFDNGNSVGIVGSGSSFYMIDLSNGIFCQTSGPEYDINSYIEEFGSEHFKLQYFTVKEPEPKKKKIKVEIPVIPKATKKKRTTKETKTEEK